MRLQDFPIGARFEYEGAIYVKTGPLTASSEQGKQRIIPPTLTQQQRIAVSVAEAGAKLSAWRSSDGRHNNRNAKRLKRDCES